MQSMNGYGVVKRGSEKKEERWWSMVASAIGLAAWRRAALLIGSGSASSSCSASKGGLTHRHLSKTPCSPLDPLQLATVNQVPITSGAFGAGFIVLHFDVYKLTTAIL